MMINVSRIAYICLFCSNLEHSIAFYHGVLGLPIERRDPEFCKLSTAGVSLGLEPGGTRVAREKTRAENPLLLQFAAASPAALATMTKHLEAHGVVIQERCREMPYGVITAFLDPDGNRLELMYDSRVDHASAGTP
ncbi:VOC family protein [Deinococcus sonorensis]|uniref:VOC family protein n=2 Tax=Deinococcus sonorensis TaxID=309891 RepID=A0AAU7U6U9_9DEIO